MRHNARMAKPERTSVTLRSALSSGALGWQSKSSCEVSAEAATDMRAASICIAGVDVGVMLVVTDGVAVKDAVVVLVTVMLAVTDGVAVKVAVVVAVTLADSDEVAEVDMDDDAARDGETETEGATVEVTEREGVVVALTLSQLPLQMLLAYTPGPKGKSYMTRKPPLPPLRSET